MLLEFSNFVFYQFGKIVTKNCIKCLTFIPILLVVCQGIDSFYELLAITELPNKELTSIHT